MHNTPEQNEAFRKAFDATNARWKAAVAQDNKETKACTSPTTTQCGTATPK